ncbi:hypothetical protein ACIA5C_47600 [Actinoplanes sp. NPDC051343]|uniref:hypothetical protein n=1 Tax=Actinoplanes sp. NPDC051343 TaxID=3363906 RepID=UPI0037AE982A
MGPAAVSRTTHFVITTFQARTAPVLTEGDRAAVRADVARWHGEAVVMRAEAVNLPLRTLISEVFGPPVTVSDVWLAPRTSRSTRSGRWCGAKARPPAHELWR